VRQRVSVPNLVAINQTVDEI